MKSKKLALALGVSALAIAGCETSDRVVNFTGARIVYEDDALGKIDLTNLVDPEQRRFKIKGSCYRDKQPSASEEFTCALSVFQTYYLSSAEFDYYRELVIAKPKKVVTPDLLDAEVDKLTGQNDKTARKAAQSIALAMRRNDIQDTIMLHSEDFCRAFKLNLADIAAGVNLGAGVTAQLLSGLATIFKDTTTIRALSGASTIVQGWQSEYNEQVLQNAAVRTVNAGIDLAREEMLIDINRRRFFLFEQDEGSESDTGVPPELDPQLRSFQGISAILGWDKATNLNVIHGRSVPIEDGFLVQTAERSSDKEDKKEKNTKKKTPTWTDTKPVPGIDRETDKSAQRLGVTSVARYPLEAAMRDAIRFHDQCRIDAGLEAASKAIERAKTTHTDRLRRPESGDDDNREGSDNDDNNNDSNERDNVETATNPERRMPDMTHEF